MLSSSGDRLAHCSGWQGFHPFDMAGIASDRREKIFSLDHVDQQV